MKPASTHLLVTREGAANAVPCSIEAASPRVSRGARVGACVGGSRVLTTGAGSIFVNKIACTATTNVVDGCLVLHDASLFSKFLVEGEDAALGVLVEVARATTAGHEWRGVAAMGKGSTRCRTRGAGGGSDVLGADTTGVAAATTASHVDGGSWHRRVRLSNAVALEGWHFGCDDFDWNVCGCADVDA